MALVAKAVSALELYELKTLEFHDALNPKAAIAERIDQIQNSKSQKEIESLQNEIASLGSSEQSRHAAETAAQAVCLAAYGPVKVAVASLLDAADIAVAAYLKEAQDAESALFAGFGLKREETTIVLRVKAVQVELSGMRGASVRDARLPTVTHPVVEFFRP